MCQSAVCKVLLFMFSLAFLDVCWGKAQDSSVCCVAKTGCNPSEFSGSFPVALWSAMSNPSGLPFHDSALMSPPLSVHFLLPCYAPVPICPRAFFKLTDSVTSWLLLANILCRYLLETECLYPQPPANSFVKS